MAKRWKDKKWRAKMKNILANNVAKLSERMNNDPAFKKKRMRGIQPTL